MSGLEDSVNERLTKLESEVGQVTLEMDALITENPAGELAANA